MRVVTDGRQVRSVPSPGTSVVSTRGIVWLYSPPINTKGILNGLLPPRARFGRVGAGAGGAGRHGTGPGRVKVTKCCCRIKRVAPVQDDRLPGLPDTYLSGYAIEDGPRLADEALQVLQKYGGKTEDLRRDPATVIERAFGIDVLVEGFGDEFDGLACSTSTFRLIIVNSRTPWSRQRFTLFHEWGHILAGDGKQGGICVDGDVMGAADRIEEMRANSFAASALMPESDIRGQAQEPVTEASFSQLVGYFRVSPDALAWRLKTLGMITPDERAALGAMSVQRAAVLGGWGAEYGNLTRNQGRPRIPLTLAERAAGAFLDGKIAARPLAALLRVDSSTLLEMHSAAGDTAADDERAVFIP